MRPAEFPDSRGLSAVVESVGPRASLAWGRRPAAGGRAVGGRGHRGAVLLHPRRDRPGTAPEAALASPSGQHVVQLSLLDVLLELGQEIGRASCRETL